MHVQTHILSGWCIANCFPCTPRQRLFAMIAASAADVDGISYVFGQQAYWNYHHTFGHNVFAAIICALTCCVFTPGRRIATFLLCTALFHLHFVMDYYGSGPGWHIHYIWPWPGMVWKNANAWNLYSWQNLTAFLGFCLWTIWIAWRLRRTPLEAIMPGLDGELVSYLRHKSNAKIERPTSNIERGKFSPVRCSVLDVR